MKGKRIAAVITAAAFLSLNVAACGGRDAHPVPTVRASDNALTCDQMFAEIVANNQRAQALAREKSDAEGTNVALAAVGVVVFFPALFFMDLSKAEQVELNALQARNSYLGNRMQSDKCTNVPPLTASGQKEADRKKRIKEAEAGGPPPKCTDVGGYETYKKETGRICQLD